MPGEPTRALRTVLIANRGEIALRIMRTAQSMGLRTVAVYSDADRHAQHVGFADEAIRIGPPPVAESYLRADLILDAARASGADAIHPGYGLLSENADFAAAVANAGLVFVGPPAAAIALMGDKARAKQHMRAAAVPCIPGFEGEQTEAALANAAGEIGYPIMIKAAAGGGGRGMRLVRDAAQLGDQLGLARSEAKSAFGDGTLILERAVTHARHVEIQIFADNYGNVIHLGERDCSTQRRHQKVIEESPCPAMTPDVRAAMGAAAIAAARAVDYRGAGTVEFLLDADHTFYFMEMNTRLQVEHPVTECVTGLDLVSLQLRIAAGEPLPITQSEVTLTGHAIEVRLCAEDPAAGFLPSTGDIHRFVTSSAPGVRVDAGIGARDHVSSFYDSMVAKVIAHGATRDEARQRLLRGLEETAVLGIASNRDFLLHALAHPVFVAGEATTTFIDDEYGDAFDVAVPPNPPGLYPAVAAVLQHRRDQQIARDLAVGVSTELLDWGSAGHPASVHRYQPNALTAAAILTITVQASSRDHYRVTIRQASGEDQTETTLDVAVAPGRETGAVAIRVDDRTATARYCFAKNGGVHFTLGGTTASFANEVLGEAQSTGQASGMVLAPMHGQLLQVLVAPGDHVQLGDKLAILEAMKMQHEIVAPVDGTVSAVTATANQQVAANDQILEITPTETE